MFKVILLTGLAAGVAGGAALALSLAHEGSLSRDLPDHVARMPMTSAKTTGDATPAVAAEPRSARPQSIGLQGATVDTLPDTDTGDEDAPALTLLPAPAPTAVADAPSLPTAPAGEFVIVEAPVISPPHAPDADLIAVQDTVTGRQAVPSLTDPSSMGGAKPAPAPAPATQAEAAPARAAHAPPVRPTPAQGDAAPPRAAAIAVTVIEVVPHGSVKRGALEGGMGQNNAMLVLDAPSSFGLPTAAAPVGGEAPQPQAPVSRQMKPDFTPMGTGIYR